MAAGTPAMFPDAVSCVLRGWGALRLATEQSFGGPYSKEKAEWLEEVVVQYFVENADLDPSEVEDYLAVLMNQEFDTLVEDRSLTKVSLDLCRMFQQCCSGNLQAVKEFIEKSKVLPHQAIMESEAVGQDNGKQGSDEGNDSPVSDDGDSDDRVSNEGSGDEMDEEDKGCLLSAGGENHQLPQGGGVEEQMDDLKLDSLQNEDESGNGDKDDEGWTVVSSKRKGHKR